MKILKDVYLQIMSEYDAVPPEHGGIMGGKNGIVTVYYHDKTDGVTDKAIYEPNAELLNAVIENWDKTGISFYGMVHSHPENETALSDGDMEYIKKLFSSLEEGAKLYFPIVLPKQTIVPYSVQKSKGIVTAIRERLEICSR